MIDKTLQRKQTKPNTNKFTSQVSQISKLDIEDINPSTTNDASESGETSVPEVKAENNLKDLTESFFDETETLQGVYFLKFYQAGNRNYSKLVKVQRKVKGSLKKRIKMALKELKKGPNLDEQDKGVLSVLPQNFHYSKKMKLTEGILHISIDKSFQENAGKDLMQDRLDQLSHTLFEFKEIKGIKVYIDGKEMHSMGKDNLKVPSILARSNFRKVIYL